MAHSRPYWEELAQFVEKREKASCQDRMSVEEAGHFHSLYLRVSSDLVRVRSCSSCQELVEYLENLLSCAYSEIYQTQGKPHFSFMHWFVFSLPDAVRRRYKALCLSVLITLLGVAMGGLYVVSFPESKPDLLGGLIHLHSSPTERVQKEESGVYKASASDEGVFASSLMTHNARVGIFTAVSGISFGFITFILLLYNGIISTSS